MAKTALETSVENLTVSSEMFRQAVRRGECVPPDREIEMLRLALKNERIIGMGYGIVIGALAVAFAVIVAGLLT